MVTKLLSAMKCLQGNALLTINSVSCAKLLRNMIVWCLQEVPIVVEAAFLLFVLNEYLSRTALLVQPLHLPPGTQDKDLRFVDLPLPLPREREPHIAGVCSLRYGRASCLCSGA